MYKYLIIVAGLLMASCSTDRNEINLYTDRHYEADQQLYDAFTAQTGIKVNIVKADPDQLIKRLELEGNNSPADIFIASDAGRLNVAKDKGLLQPVNLNYIDGEPTAKEPGNHWIGLTKRTRIIVYHKGKVSPEELSTYEALAGPAWNGRVLVRSSTSPYNQTLLASIIHNDGYDSAMAWANAIVRNMAQEPKGNDRDQVKAVAAGVGDVAIVNSYYLGLLLNSSNPEEVKVAESVGVFFPNQMHRGSHVNVSGMGLLKGSSNKENAKRLMEFLLTKESQQILTDMNYEYPVIEGVGHSELLKSWGDFKPDMGVVTHEGSLQGDAVKIFNRVGWK